MKRFLIILCLFFIGTISFAQTEKELKFVYINGSNNNTEKMKNWFFDGVYKMHPEMKKAFEEDSFVKEHLLEKGNFQIALEPVPFYWGNKSQTELERLISGLNMTKIFSPRIAQTVRTGIAYCMHDAIWVQKYHNMESILNELHVKVMEEASKGNKVVLFGYSAGSFVTYQYLFYKLPNISMEDLFNRTGITPEEKDFVKAHPMNNTCIDALVESKLAVLSMNGHLIPNINAELFKKNYMEIDKYTNMVCIPKGTVKGIVNFASPLVLFYSDISDPSYEFTYYNKLLYQYIIENNMFWLTVNYSDDPLGYPSSRNLSQEELEILAKIDIEPHLGFVYDKSNVKSRRTFIGAHTSYWSTAKYFSKAVASAYKEGFNLYYHEPQKTTDKIPENL